jgi:hypothetical protein
MDIPLSKALCPQTLKGEHFQAPVFPVPSPYFQLLMTLCKESYSLPLSPAPQTPLVSTLEQISGLVASFSLVSPRLQFATLSAL